MYRQRVKRVHFVGIGGIGMSGIAEVLLNLGYQVSGSDLKESDITRNLAQMGGVITYGHRAENVQNAQVVVYSSAVRPQNPEVVAAKAAGIPVIPRAEMLAELMRLKYGIAIAGAHGKTTTTSMIAHLLFKAGLDPTAVIGGRVDSFGSNAKLGQGELLVAEADESDGSFLKLSPTIAVVTNIDPEHLDHYTGGIEQIKETFLSFLNKIPFYGLAVICLENEHLQALLPRIEKRHVTYGLMPQADFSARDIQLSGFHTSFEVVRGREALGRIELAMPGEHNVRNGLATVAVGLELGVPMETIREGLYQFRGVQRRFQLKGEVGSVMVIDDYGHHPTEARATLAAARRGFGRRLIVAFQPHRYTRTRDLLQEFATAFYDADHLVVTEIYSAGEDPIAGIDGQRLCDALREHGHKDVVFIREKERIADHLAEVVQPGDMVVTLGAGDIWTVGRDLLLRLEAQNARLLTPSGTGSGSGPGPGRPS
jgi:UDP-N-acetylmuramate--alanine ligase